MRRPLVAACGIVLAAVAAFAPFGAQATGPTVIGAGSTWVQIALDQWRADIARQGFNINYQGNGSSAGRQMYMANAADFAASEIPFQPDELPTLQAEHKTWQYMPDVAGGTSLMYNLHSPAGARITSLRLDPDAAARIFTGTLTSWQDPKIQALNPGLVIRETVVKPIIRSDGSGTSAQLSLYLADQSPAVWRAFVNAYQCPEPCSLWPQFPGSTQQALSDGVANFVASDTLGSGAIGYVEAGYAFGRGFPVASLHNLSGHFAQPTAANVSTALTHAKLHADLTQDLTFVYRAPEANAYPMSSYSYLITPTAQGFGFDRSKGYVLGTWIIYIACGGQREAAPLGYSPIPPNLIQADFDAVRRIPGAPAPPPIDPQHCPNPTVKAAVSGAGGQSGAPGTTQAPTSGSTSSSTNGSGTSPVGGADTSGNTSPATSTDANATQGGVRVRTLSDDERKALFNDAELAAQRTPGFSIDSLVVAGAVVLAMVFGPVVAATIGSRRRRPRRVSG